MQRRWMGVLALAILACSAAGTDAVARGMRTHGLIHAGMCPKNDAARVILSKDPYCASRHLTGDSCDARWKAYWFETAQYNNFLAGCRMRHWPEHKS